MANSVDPDQTPYSVASDLGLECCSGLSDRMLMVSTVNRTISILLKIGFYFRILKRYIHTMILLTSLKTLILK